MVNQKLEAMKAQALHVHQQVTSVIRTHTHTHNTHTQRYNRARTSVTFSLIPTHSSTPSLV